MPQKTVNDPNDPFMGNYGLSEGEKLAGAVDVAIIGHISNEGLNSGKPRMRIALDENGKAHGRVVVFHDNGNVLSNAVSKHGVPVGTAKYFNKNGDLCGCTRYGEDGEIISKEIMLGGKLQHLQR